MDAVAQIALGVIFLVAAVAYIVLKYLRRRKVSKRFMGELVEDHQIAINSRTDKLTQFIYRRLGKTKYFLSLSTSLEIASSAVSPAKFVLDSIGFALLAAIFGFWLQNLTGLLLAVLITSIVRSLLPTWQLNRRRAKFQEQLDYTLSLFSASIRAGHSLARAIEIVAIQSEAPTSQEFSKAMNAVRLGRDMGDSLMQVAERMKSQELEWVVQSINIHRESGGNLTEMFETVVSTIKDRNAIRVLIRTLSTDGRLSGQIMAAMPIAVVLIFGLQNPSNYSMFISTSIGNVMLAIAAVLYLAGVLWIRKIVKVSF